MNQAYSDIRVIKPSGNLREDVYKFLCENNHRETAEHCMKVGQESNRIAMQYGIDEAEAEYAGYLHDISVVFPNEVRIRKARQLNIDVLSEEEYFPMIVHQKLSRSMAIDLFEIDNPGILSAVECHTTLKRDATKLDMVLFVADKIAWDQKGTPPYLNDITDALAVSLEHASFSYINYLWKQRDKLRVIHPWLRDAYLQLSSFLE